MNFCRGQRWWRFCLTLLVGTCLRAWSDTPPLSTDFVIRPWRSVDGVATLVSRSITLAPDETLWVGTFDGVYHLSGDRTTRHTPEGAPGYRSYWFVCLLTARNGSLYAGTGEGVLRFEEGRWTPFPASTKPPSGMVEGLTETPNGNLFVSISTNLFVWDGKTFEPFASPFRRVGDTSPAHLVVDALGVVWARTDSSITRLEKGAWHTVLVVEPTNGWVRGITPAQRGGVWVATDEKIMRYRGDDVDRVGPLPESQRNDWLQMLQDSRGNLWIGAYDKGLSVLKVDGRWLGGARRSDFPSDHIYCLIEDAEGNVYAGSNGLGLFQLRPRRGTPLLPDKVGPDGTGGFSAIVAVAPDTLLAGTGRGAFYRVSIPKREVRQTESPFPPDESVNALLVDRGGHLWAGTQTLGLWRSSTLQSKDLEQVATSSAPINTLYEDRQRNLFVATGQGVFLLHGSALEPVTSGIGTNLNALCFAADSSDRLWIGSSIGLLQYNQGGVTRVELPGGAAAQPEVVALHIDRHDQLWAGLRDGTVLFRREGRWLAVPKNDLMHTPGINFIAEDVKGRLWIGSQAGLLGFPIRETVEFAEGNGPRPPVFQLTGKDELIDGDFSSTSSPAWCTDERGILWFVNAAAVTRVDPFFLTTNHRTSDVTLADVQIGSRSYYSRKLSGKVVPLPRGNAPVVVKYETSIFTTPERTYFEYRLDSPGSKWIPNGRNRELRFADLGPGPHEIEIRAINSDGVTRDQGSVFRLEVQRYLYETLWFRSGAGVASLAVVLLAGRKGLRRYVKQREAHLAEREAATRAELKRVSIEADQMRLEARLQDAQRLEALGTLAGGIAHDFNNLLQSILGNAELGRLKIDEPAEMREHLDEVARAAERARVLVAQILLFSRREKPRRIPLLAGPVVKETLKLLRSGIPPSIEFDVAIPDALPPILGDPSAIQRIVTNLGTNAAHAMRAHGGKLSIRLSTEDIDATGAAALGEVKPGKFLCLTVSDTGHGMDAETQRRVFEPFFTTKQPGEGTGLGLSVVQGLVHSLEGAIRLRSQPGAGTVFEILLPVTSETPTATAPLKTQVPPPGSLRILVVDDDQSVLEFVLAAGRRLGHTCTGFDRPERALARFAASPKDFDLILSDLSMPGMDGRELEVALHQVRPEIPIVLATGYGEGMDEASARQSGFAALMAKPYTLDALAAVIARAATVN
ncbi:MAG TPA: ATP-binding protein [Candidatus Limnocylindria bacterium]|jgi:signal transduction histidine kinase/ligand-binding sensor domain-containing protein/CheY-like chemotaxis protein|nr:ATP-binding protein [Candidatus Limnocylindria bacterium]